MREFYLVNEEGTTYFFNHRNKTLISKIGNLGFSFDNTFLKYDDDYVLVDFNTNQGSIDFDVVFLKGYQGYNDFLNFINRSTNARIRLFYKYDGVSRFCYVTLNKITKTELESNTIQSSISFDKLSLWLDIVTTTIRISEDGEGKMFPFVYPYMYSSSYVGTASIVNDGDTKASLDFYIYGAVNYPIIEIYKNGDIVANIKLLVISDECSITIKSDLTDQCMLMVENGVESNIYSKQDFTCDNFIFLEKGNYVVKFISGASKEATCKISMRKGYWGH